MYYVEISDPWAEKMTRGTFFITRDLVLISSNCRFVTMNSLVCSLESVGAEKSDTVDISCVFIKIFPLSYPENMSQWNYNTADIQCQWNKT